ncbi:hypothetical protein [uncultured Roseibium sp.]|uniref:hypothetical protein n=1 Tax=uncultured Roseibium sp. TaxID=1936171 RepID=UPI00259925CB|nr:hypothetical protein [uncultured Roseibium sp.]
MARLLLWELQPVKAITSKNPTVSAAAAQAVAMAVISWGRAIAFGATLHKALMPQQKYELRESPLKSEPTGEEKPALFQWLRREP